RGGVATDQSHAAGGYHCRGQAQTGRHAPLPIDRGGGELAPVEAGAYPERGEAVPTPLERHLSPAIEREEASRLRRQEMAPVEGGVDLIHVAQIAGEGGEHADLARHASEVRPVESLPAHDARGRG